MGMGDVTRYLKVFRQYIDRLVEQGKLRSKHTSTGKVFFYSDVSASQRQRIQKVKRCKAKN